MKRLAVFASGSGTNFEAIAAACRDGHIDAEVVLLVCDKPGAKVLDRADKFGVPAMTFVPRTYYDKSEYEEQIVRRLQAANVDLVCLAGYMRIVGPTLLAAYPGRIINIHPALLPSFKGAHGIRDAFEYGVKVFGVTIHYVDHTLDGGQIIAQRSFEYHGSDIDEVEAKIHEIEHQLYPETIQKLIEENKI